jgi:hypothetical protein
VGASPPGLGCFSLVAIVVDLKLKMGTSQPQALLQGLEDLAGLGDDHRRVLAALQSFQEFPLTFDPVLELDDVSPCHHNG